MSGLRLKAKFPVGMGIETAKIGCEGIHEQAVGFAIVTGVSQIHSFEDRIGIRIIRIFSGQHLFHLILRSSAAFNDRSCPGLERLIRFTPVVLLRIPHSPVFKTKRYKPKGGYVEAPRFDLAGQVRVAAVAPFLVRYDSENLTGYGFPGPTGRNVST